MINPFFLSMLGSITRQCALRGYDLLISFQQMHNDWHVAYQDSHRSDGIILLGYGDYQLYRAKLEHLVEMDTKFRSEEHTSELKSLMRISDAVFCVKKTK